MTRAKKRTEANAAVQADHAAAVVPSAPAALPATRAADNPNVLAGITRGLMGGLPAAPMLVRACLARDVDDAIDMVGEVVGAMQRDLKPTSMLEQMLVDQLVMTQCQIINMQRLLREATTYEAIESMALVVSRLQADFRQTTAALQAWRSPPQKVVAVQFNRADQQIVQGVVAAETTQ